MKQLFDENMYSYVKNYNIVMLLNSKEDILFVKKYLENNNFSISGYYFNDNNTFIFTEDLKFDLMKKEKIYFLLKQQKNYRIFLYKKILLLLKHYIKKKENGNN